MLDKRGLLTIVGAIAAVAALSSCLLPGRPEPDGLSGATIIGEHGRQPGQFSQPRAVIAVDNDTVIVMDRTGRLQRMNIRTNELLEKWNIPRYDHGTPTGMTYDPKTNTFWVADTHYQRIIQYASNGEILHMWGKEGTGPGELIFPTDIVPDPDGESVWICEYGLRCRVMQYTLDGEFIKEWGSGEYEYSDLSRPMAIAFNDEGNLVVADAGNHRILTFDRDGNLLQRWGVSGSEPGQLKYPYDLAIDKDGSLFIVEYGNSRVSHFTADGEFLGHWGKPGFYEGELNRPWGLTLMPGGEVIIADTENSRLHRIDRPDRYFVPAGDGEL